MPHSHAVSFGKILGILLSSVQNNDDIDVLKIPFPKHPFGHDVVLQGAPNFAQRKSFLISPPGGAQKGKVAMVKVLAHSIKNRDPESLCMRMRITRVPKNILHQGTNSLVHDLYFELITYDGIFICGGFSEYELSARELVSIFNLIAHLYKKPFEIETLSPGNDERVRLFFDITYDDIVKESGKKP